MMLATSYRVGMTHARTLIITALFALAGSSASVFAQTHIGGPGATAELFNTMCAGCHSKDGSGGPAGTPSLLLDDMFDHVKGDEIDRRYFKAIKEGVPQGGMEPFKGSLNDEKIWSLVVHIRELQHKAWREHNNVTPDDDAKNASHVFSTQRRNFRIERVAGHEPKTNLKTPWAIAFVPTDAQVESLRGATIINEKRGTMRVLHADGTLSEPVAGIPKVSDRGQAGLLDVELHPDYATNGWVYIGFTDFLDRTDDKGEKRRAIATKVVRGKLTPDAATKGAYGFTDQETIFETRPENYITNAGVHFGCRIAFDPPIGDKPRAGYVYIGIGEHGQQDHAQVLTRHNGKIHRLHDDGKVPQDNPFIARASEDSKILPSIWSFGHRNPQGLAFNTKGELFNTEHGPRGGDEFNQVAFAGNYGWPLVAYSINYADTPFRTPWPELDPKLADKQIKLPALRWLPSLGACGLAGGDALINDPQPQDNWNETDFFAGGLAMACVRRVRVIDGKVTEHEEVVYGLGRVRDVVWGPKKTDANGKSLPRDLYVVLNGPDQIIRLVDAGK